jgi:hypothetical protein
MKKKLSLSEQLIHSTVRIECELGSGSFTSGTGYYFQFEINGNSIPLLVTNKHVIEDSITGHLHFTLEDEFGNPNIGDKIKYRISNFENSWILHPEDDIDLCVFPLAKIFQDFRKTGKEIYFMPFQKNEAPSDDNLRELNALEDITMIGYPNGLWDEHNNLPIIRKGITATPPYIDFDNKPEFLIDAACFPGSSGSPFLILNEGSYTPKLRVPVLGDRVYLLGTLYAGPQYTAEGDIITIKIPIVNKKITVTDIPTNLGFVIKTKKLLEFEDIIKSMM